MAIQHIIGSTDAVVTGGTQVESDSNSHVVTVEGPWDVIEEITDYSDYVPSGFTFVEAQKRNNQGFGTIEIRCQKFGSSDASTTPTRTTWRIEIAAVDTPLYCHPDITSVENARKEIDCWLNTESGKRFDSSGNPQWVDEFGTPQPVNNQGAIKYINAWKKGVETYLRYFPIVEKISTYSRLPGCSMSESSTTSGTADFSADIGKWSKPAVKLSGYNDDGWYKSGDTYVENGDRSWTRTEQWTWTPSYDDDDLSWIYDKAQT